MDHVRFAPLGCPEVCEKGNSRRIAAEYMRQMIIETRNAIGRGLRTPRQLLLGMVAGEKKSPSVRLSLKQRKALTSKEARKSVLSGSKHPTSTTTYRFERFEQLNYYYDSRQPKGKLHLISLFRSHDLCNDIQHIVAVAPCGENTDRVFESLREASGDRNHWSICMDGTDVSFSKYMTAAFHWPEIDKACWAPPMERL